MRMKTAVVVVLLVVLGAACKRSPSTGGEALAAPPAAGAVKATAATEGGEHLSCIECEMKGSHIPTGCPNTSPTANLGTNDPAKFGCDGFAGADGARCKALLACLRTKRCATGSDPTSCLCGSLVAPECAQKSIASLTGACRDAYVTAAGKGDLMTLFFSTDSPVGVANNLYACDVDRHCSCP